MINLKGNSYEISDRKLIQEIANAIDSVLGEGASNLILNTLRLVQNIDYSESLSSSKLESLEQSLKKTVSEPVSNRIIEALVIRMEKYRTSR
jgi:hypothetical protein